MRVLVTGGAGLIGSNLVKRLVESGEEVFVVDNLWRGNVQNLQIDGREIIPLDSRFFQYDLRDVNHCNSVTEGIDVVVHLADIVAGINFVFSNELFVFQSNNLINSNVLGASIKNGVKKYLYVGTACSYPIDKQNVINTSPLIEDDVYPANPESSYGWSKLMGEYECELAQRESRIETSILRLHNVYGPPCEISPEKSQVIPALCRKAALYPEEEFVVWGSGQQRRAFVYVDDVIDAIGTALTTGMGKGVIQIGPTVSHSIKDIAELIVSISGKDIEVEFDPLMPEGDKDRTANNDKALEELGWRPTTLLEDGLKQTYTWVEEKIKEIGVGE